MQLETLIENYAAGTQAVLDALGDYRKVDLDSKHPDGWSPRQVVHHLADSETNSFIRLHRLIGEEPGTILAGYDEAAWALNPILGYESLPIDSSLLLFISVRQASLETIKRISEADLLRSGTHTESGIYTLKNWFDSYIAHPIDHAAQIERAFKKLM